MKTLPPVMTKPMHVMVWTLTATMGVELLTQHGLSWRSRKQNVKISTQLEKECSI